MEYLRRCWATIDLDAIAHNYHVISQKTAPSCRFMAVVKADAYGHGDGYVSRMLQSLGADWFGVSNVNEAVSLRKQGITKPILIFGYTPPEFAPTLAKLNISQTVYSLSYAQALSAAAKERGIVIDCHIKLDTGMGRIGLAALPLHTQQAAAEAAAIHALPALSCTGIFTHFSCADEIAADSRAYTQAQFDAFMDVIARLEAQGITFALQHCCNSAGTMAYPEMHLDMVRVGAVLYGLSPSADFRGMMDLAPAMSLYAAVSMVKEAVDAGTYISYGRRYQTERPGQTLAAVAIGYADGYRRKISKGRVLIGGQFAPVVGTVCMDQMVVDASGISHIEEGAVATVVGKSGEHAITLDELAELHGTINYEEACLIARRVPRVFLQDGKEIAATDYVLTALDT